MVFARHRSCRFGCALLLALFMYVSRCLIIRHDHASASFNVWPRIILHHRTIAHIIIIVAHRSTNMLGFFRRRWDIWPRPACFVVDLRRVYERTQNLLTRTPPMVSTVSQRSTNYLDLVYTYSVCVVFFRWCGGAGPLNLCVCVFFSSHMYVTPFLMRGSALVGAT